MFQFELFHEPCRLELHAAPLDPELFAGNQLLFPNSQHFVPPEARNLRFSMASFIHPPRPGLDEKMSALVHSVFWDIVGGQPYPQPIDTWVLNNGTALVVGRMDSLEVSDMFVFSRFTGMLLTDSSDTSQNPTCGYGTGSDFDIEGVQYGIVVTASNAPGYKFTNLFLESYVDTGKAAVQLRTGGSLPPKIEINGVQQGGPWADGAFPPPPVGELVVVNMLP